MDAPDTLLAQVDRALETIRPYLKADGGNVRLLDITEEGVARVELLGSCGICPMSQMTMRAGVEEAVRQSVPSITGVIAVNG